MLPQALYEYYPSPWETSSGSWEIPKAGNQDDHHLFRYDLTIANQKVVSSNPSKWTNELNDYESLSQGLSKICCKHPSLTTKLLGQAEGSDAQQSVKSVKMMDWSDSRCVIGARVGQNRSTAVKSKAPINSERRLWRILTQLRRKPIREFGPVFEADIFFPGRPPPKNLSSVCLSIVGNDFDSIRLKSFFLLNHFNSFEQIYWTRYKKDWIRKVLDSWKVGRRKTIIDSDGLKHSREHTSQYEEVLGSNLAIFYLHYAVTCEQTKPLTEVQL